MADEVTLIASDKKYRQYMTEVERALRAFEYTSEWADLIAALGRLNKVLLQNNKYQVVPRRHVIGKRLAQCLHPALPSGVHLKCLETYDIIFQAIGKDKLVEDLFIYGSGIFPLLGQAAMNVKPMLLTVIETHLLSLGTMLRPALTGMVVGLLPGLEEGAETYDRVNSLLEKISVGVGLSYFYSAIWEAMLLSASVRCQAAAFVMLHFNKKQSLDDQLFLIGRNPSVMVQAISSALLDPNILVQRSVLDVLLLCFPLHSPHLTKQDHLQHMLASLKVLLRRDMSLNRRLYAWLLGTDSNGVSLLPVNFQLSLAKKRQAPGAGNDAASDVASNAASNASKSAPSIKNATPSSASTAKDQPIGVPAFHYLEVYSKDLLVQALVQLARNPEAWATPSTLEHHRESSSTPASTSVAERLKLFRILMTLLEKPEIGPLIIEDVLIEIFRFLYSLCLEEQRNAQQEREGHDWSEGKLTLQVEVSDVRRWRRRWLLDALERVWRKPSHSHSMWYLVPIASTHSSPHHLVAGSEVVKTANLLFSSFEPYYMWDYLGRLFFAACHYADDPDDAKSDYGQLPWEQETISRLRGKANIMELCDLVSFLLDNASLETYTETQTEHLPSLLYHIISAITRFVNALNDRELTASLGLCMKLLGKVMPSMSTGQDSHSPSVEGATINASSDDVAAVETPKGKNSAAASSTPRPNRKNLAPEPPNVSVNASTPPRNDAGSVRAPGSPSRLTHPPPVPSPIKTFAGSASPLMPSVGNSPEKIQIMEVENLSPQDLLQACILSFHEFFSTLVIKKIFRQKEILSQCLELLSASSSATASTLALQRQDVTRVATGAKGAFYVSEAAPGRTDGSAFTEAFALACQLLVEFSSFPRYQSSLPPDFFSPAGSGAGLESLPNWAKCLLATSCFVDSFPVQKSAIATTLDLVTLTQTVLAQQAAAAAAASSPSSLQIADASSVGNVSVVLNPALSVADLENLANNSRYFSLVAYELWRWMSDDLSDRHRTAVELLVTLHQVSPSPRICEDIISSAMSSPDIVHRLAGFKKFFSAWHLTRELRLPATPSLPSSSPSPRSRVSGVAAKPSMAGEAPLPRTFHRSLLLGLDALDNPADPCRGLSLTWLTHAVQRGDVARILEPLLLILLHPDTARISVQHVQLAPPTATILTRCHQGPISSKSKRTRPSLTSTSPDLIEAFVYNLSSRDGDTTTTSILHLALAANFSTLKDQLAIAPARTPGVDPKALTATDVKIEAVVARVKTVGTGESGEGVVPGPADVTVWIGGAQYILPKDLFGNSGRTERPRQNGNGTEALFDDGEANDGTDIQIKVDHFVDSHSSAVDTSSDESDVITDEKRTRGREGGVTVSIPHSRTTTFKEAELARNTSGSFGAGGRLDMPAKGRSISASTPTLNTDGGSNPESAQPGKPALPSIHSHMLLYSQLYDTQRSLYALLKLRSMITASPRLFLCAIATKNMSASTTPFLAQIQSLLSRHRNAIFGRNFYGSLQQPDTTFRNSMYLEVLISLLLYYIRGYFPNLLSERVSRADVIGNKQVQTISAEVLSLLLSELVTIVRESGSGFATYINDVLARCKVQKAVLHCLSASVYNTRNPRQNREQEATTIWSHTLTESIVYFNEEILDNQIVEAYQMQLLRLVLSIMILEDQLVSLKATGITGSSLSAVGKVKKRIDQTRRRMSSSSSSPPKSAASGSSKGMRSKKGRTTPAPPSVTGGNFNTVSGVDVDKSKTGATQSVPTSGSSAKYVPGVPCAQQSLFLSALLGALRQQHMCHMHRHWATMSISALPYVGGALRSLATSIVNQICRNLELLAVEYAKRGRDSGLQDDALSTSSIGSSMNTSGYGSSGSTPATSLAAAAKIPRNVPPDHVITLLEGMTTICHYALLDTPSPLASVYPSPGSGGPNYDGASAAQILSNLVNAFSSVDPTKEGSKSEEYVRTYSSPILEARKGLLSIMPRIISGLALLWNSVSENPYATTGSKLIEKTTSLPPPSHPPPTPSVDETKSAAWTWGDPKLVRQFILEFLSPICLQHGVNMLGAVAVVWNERQRRAIPSTDVNVSSKVVPAFGADQHLLVDIVAAIKVLPTDSLIQTVKQVIKTPPPTNQDAGSKKKCPLEVSVLQFFYTYLQRLSASAMLDSWPQLLTLLKDGLSILDLVPQGKFLLLTILDDFVKRAPPLEERSDVRNLQDITTRILTDISQVAGSSLEQKSWLSRSYVVKAGNQGVALGGADDAGAGEDDEGDEVVNVNEGDDDDADEDDEYDDDDVSSVGSAELGVEAGMESGPSPPTPSVMTMPAEEKKPKKRRFKRKMKRKSKTSALEKMATTSVALGMVTVASNGTSGPSGADARPTDVAQNALHPGINPGSTNAASPTPPPKPPTADAQYSVPALHLLAELLAPLLDIVFGNDEKDKVVNLLYGIMYNVFPYLKNHTQNNVPSFRACSQLLASLSSYAYLRRAWKKEAFELLMDPQFFQMDLVCVGFWRTIVDHLMSYERVVFKDLMTRVTLPTNQINLFGSREAEYEQRSALLKRLAFVVFASDVDQYQKSMPEIQERLSEALRFQEVPNLHATVFLCYRILLLRMTPHHLTSLWPTISTELVQVLLQLEECVSSCPGVKKPPGKGHADSDSETPPSSTAQAARASDPAWLSLFLAACKLLDLVTALPADFVPQFQLYRWAFIGGEQRNGRNSHANGADAAGGTPSGVATFTPHIHRLALLGNKKFFGISSNRTSLGGRESTPPTLRVTPGRLLLTQTQIKSPKDLVPFFNALGSITANLSSHPSTNPQPSLGMSRKPGLSTMQLIEKCIERDLVESLPSS